MLKNTVNVEFFAQYIFSRRALNACKFEVSENYYHNRTNRINWYMRENLATRTCILMLDARKFSCAKICTFKVCHKLFPIETFYFYFLLNQSLLL